MVVVVDVDIDGDGAGDGDLDATETMTGRMPESVKTVSDVVAQNRNIADR